MAEVQGALASLVRSESEGQAGAWEQGASLASMVARTRQGKLVICPTPIGNLGDMTPRAKEALAAADTVCAEDTRVTGKLLASFGISCRMERLDENTVGQRAAAIVERVLSGEVIAYCTDAGMPGVSDPGQRLVAAARAAGAPVEVLPGPTATATAYVASGFTCPRFYFGGFFPRKEGQRAETLAALQSLDAVLLFYESPHRIVGALRAVVESMPYRQVAVCRELTKLHEEVAIGTAQELAEAFAEREAAGGVKGEIVLVIDAPSEQEHACKAQDAREGASDRAAQLAAEGMRAKQISKQLAAEFGLSRNEAYDMALAASKQARAE